MRPGLILLFVLAALAAGCRQRQAPETAAAPVAALAGTAAPPKRVARAPAPPQPPPATAAKLRRAAADEAAEEADRAFAVEAAARALAAIEAARIAGERSASPAVKALAKKVERDQTAAADELGRIAGEAGIELPSSVGDEAPALEALAAAHEPELDRRYLATFGVDGPQRTIALFERELRTGKDARLTDFARQHLPALRDELALAAPRAPR